MNEGATFCGKCGTPVGGGASPARPQASAGNSTFKLGILIAAALLVVSTFLPYASVSAFGFSQSVSLMDGGDGIFFIALAAVAIVGALISKPLISMIGSVLAALLSFFELIDMNVELGGYSAFVDKGLGLYLSVIAAVALAVLSVLFFLTARKNK